MSILWYFLRENPKNGGFLLMKKLVLAWILLMTVMTAGCVDAGKRERKEKVIKPTVTLGIENFEEYAELFAGKRIGLITNQTGVDSKLRSSEDILLDKTNLTGIFVPEHGLFGAIAAGDNVNSEEYKGVKVYSLYGVDKRPSMEMLNNIDLMAIDIQDVGARHYTYVSTMAYAMEACAKAGKQFVVFDRPNPIGGLVEGPILKKGLESFIGLYPVPLRHGMTIGEYALYINDTKKLGLDLTVIPMKGWRRDMYWWATGLPWVGTSPQIPTADTAILYMTTGFLGDTNLSVGIGTTKPFYYVGAPFANKDEVAAKLNALQLPGVFFRPIAYIPNFGAFAKELCQGVEIYITEPNTYRAVLTGANILRCFDEMYPNKIVYPARYGNNSYKIDIAVGENTMRVGVPLEKLLPRWNREAQEFAEQTKPYMLYK